MVFTEHPEQTGTWLDFSSCVFKIFKLCSQREPQSVRYQTDGILNKGSVKFLLFLIRSVIHCGTVFRWFQFVIFVAESEPIEDIVALAQLKPVNKIKVKSVLTFQKCIILTFNLVIIELQ